MNSEAHALAELGGAAAAARAAWARGAAAAARAAWAGGAWAGTRSRRCALVAGRGFRVSVTRLLWAARPLAAQMRA